MRKHLLLILTLLCIETFGHTGNVCTIKESPLYKVSNIKPGVWDIPLYKKPVKHTFLTPSGVELWGAFLRDSSTIVPWVYLNPNQASTTQYQIAEVQVYCEYRKRTSIWPPTWGREWGYKTWTATVEPGQYEGWTDWDLQNEEKFHTEYWYPYYEVISTDVSVLSLEYE